MKHSDSARAGLRVVAAVFTFMLLTAGLAWAGGHEGGSLSHEKLMDLLWRVMNFAVLVLILAKFLVKPIKKALATRRQAIADQFEDLSASQSEAERLYRDCETKLAAIDVEVQEILEKARTQGEKEKERIIAAAERAAQDIRRQAKMAIDQELAAAKKRLRAEIAEETVRVAEELIRREIRPEDQSRLIAENLDKMGTVQ